MALITAINPTMYEDAVRWTNRNMTFTHAPAPPGTIKRPPTVHKANEEEPSYLFQKLPTPNAAPPPHTSDFLSRPRAAYLYILIGLILCSELVVSVRGSDMESSVGGRGHFTPTWAVHIPEGDVVAQEVANEHGMVIVGKVITLFLIISIKLKKQMHARHVNKSLKIFMQ